MLTPAAGKAAVSALFDDPERHVRRGASGAHHDDAGLAESRVFQAVVLARVIAPIHVEWRGGDAVAAGFGGGRGFAFALCAEYTNRDG